MHLWCSVCEVRTTPPLLLLRSLTFFTYTSVCVLAQGNQDPRQDLHFRRGERRVEEDSCNEETSKNTTYTEGTSGESYTGLEPHVTEKREE